MTTSTFKQMFLSSLCPVGHEGLYETLRQQNHIALPLTFELTKAYNIGQPY